MSGDPKSDAPKSRPVIRGRIAPPGPKAPGKRIYLATPAYGSLFAGEYVRSIFRLLSAKSEPPVEYLFSYFDYADVVVARNYLVSDFYFNRPDCSHLLFVDDDMGFDPGLIAEMIALDEDVVGTLYPKRRIDLHKLHAAGDQPFEQAMAGAVEFIGDVIKPVERKGPFIGVIQCGAGVLLISRACVERMIATLPDLVDTHRYKRLGFAEKFPQFLTLFDKIATPELELSEDFSFCRRWAEQCGGKIWAHTESVVRHMGTQIVSSRYADLAPRVVGRIVKPAPSAE